MRFREGDLIETHDGVIFDVKGLLHPPDRVIAFPRFIPSLDGTRRRKNNSYGKVYSLPERFMYLQQKAPELIVYDPVFDETLCEVPTNKIAKHYKPNKKLQELRSKKETAELEEKALQLASTLKHRTKNPWSSIGISGSLMVGLDTPTSDIDPIVYGAEQGYKAYAVLQEMRQERDSHFKQYTRQELHVLFDFRSKDTIMNFEDFVETESRKAFQGKFMGTDYFIRFVKNWREIPEKYGDMQYKNSGYATIRATVADASEALFTPCTYRIEDVIVIDGPKLETIKEVVSFRGRFCQQAKDGEGVVVQGKLEKVVDTQEDREYYRIILGNKSSDYMVLSGK